MSNLDLRITEALRNKSFVTKYIVYPMQNTDVLNYQIRLSGFPSLHREDVEVIYNSQIIPHWAETKGAVWIKIPILYAKTPFVLYVLSGDPTPPNNSNGYNIFLQFDNAKTRAKWNTPSAEVISTSINGIPALKSTTTTCHFLRQTVYYSQNYIVEAIAQTPSAISQYLFVCGRKADNDTDTGANVVAGIGGNNGYWSVWPGQTAWVTTGLASNIIINTWHALKLALINTNWYFWGDAKATYATTLRLSGTTTQTANTTAGLTFSILANQYITDYKMRIYLANEPVVKKISTITTKDFISSLRR